MDKLPASRRQIAVLALCAVRLCLAEEEGSGEEGDGGGEVYWYARPTVLAGVLLLVLGLGCAVAVLCWVGAAFEAAGEEWIWREYEEGADRARSSGDAPSSIELRAIEQVCVFNAHVCVCVHARECTHANTKCACVCARTHTHPAYTTRPVFVLARAHRNECPVRHRAQPPCSSADVPRQRPLVLLLPRLPPPRDRQQGGLWAQRPMAWCGSLRQVQAKNLDRG